MVTEQGEIMSEVAKSGRKKTVLEILRSVSPLAPSPYVPCYLGNSHKDNEPPYCHP